MNPDNTTIDRSVPAGAVSASARISGQTRITGARTRIGEGAVIRDSYIENAVIEPGATVVDSVLVTEGELPPPRGDASGFGAKWRICADEVTVGRGARVEGCLVQNTSIGAGSVCRNAALLRGRIGARNTLEDFYGVSVVTGENVIVRGPTEAGGAWFGYGTRIDRCGFYSGIFSNDFYVFGFNPQSGTIEVRETIELPHVSRYGMNSIDSGNSGNIVDQPDGSLRSLGAPNGLWKDRLLLGQPLTHSPLCLVAGWTKVIGKSPLRPQSAGELVADTLSTYLMPFSVSAPEASSVIGQVMIGEKNNGFGYRDRVPGWTFSYAPGAVIAAVRRLVEAGTEARLADRVVRLSLENALELLKLYAHERNLEAPDGAKFRGARGWKGWLAAAHEIYRFHLDSELWQFSGGEPVAWRQQDGRWVPAEGIDLAAVAPDWREKQVSEEEILSCAEAPLPKRLGVAAAELLPTLEPPSIDPQARVAPGAWVGPGSRVLGSSEIADGAVLFRAAVTDSVVGRGARAMRSVVERSRLGANARARCALLSSSTVGEDSTVDCARVSGSSLPRRATIFPFAEVENASIAEPCIIGTTVRNAKVDSYLMSYHMPGLAENFTAEAVEIEHGGSRHVLRTIPMLGGGMRMRGEPGREVSLACAFVGSNTVLDAGAHVGFGSFVLGRLTGAEGLPPLTVSTAPGPEKDLIGAVATNFPHIVISHFIQWNYNAHGPEKAHLVALMVKQMLEEGRAAVRAELKRREGGTDADGGRFAKYKSLRLYSDAQLGTGLDTYERELADGRWEMAYADGELRFTGKGHWKISDGAARWVTE